MGVRVLVVDDSDDIRRLLTAIIDGSDNSWSVIGEAADGCRAIEIAEQTQPDVVLLDLSMPIMDGLEALPKILQAVPTAAVVVLSGFPSHTARAAALAAGASDYLEKDALVATLIPQLQMLLPGVADRENHRPLTDSEPDPGLPLSAN